MNHIEQLYKEWQALQPLKPEDESRLKRKFMLEFNYNSNHIEGNTLTYGQTELLLLFGKVINEASMKDLEEMKAHNVCLKMIQEEAADAHMPLTETFIRQLHHTLLREDYTLYRQLPDGTTTSYVIHAGIYKTRPNSVITVTGERFEYASPEETPALMTDLVEWYNAEEQKGEMSPIELATVLHYRYIRIHPFEDGNGRMARLLVNYILTRHHYPMIVVKSHDKDRYLTALNRCDVQVGPTPSVGAHAELEQLKPFVDYMTQCLEAALTICIKAAKGESVEEENDFNKQIAILKKQKHELKIQKSTQAVKHCRHIFFNLAIYWDEKLTDFYTLFDNKYICSERPQRVTPNILDIPDSFFKTSPKYTKPIQYKTVRDLIKKATPPDDYFSLEKDEIIFTCAHYKYAGDNDINLDFDLTIKYQINNVELSSCLSDQPIIFDYSQADWEEQGQKFINCISNKLLEKLNELSQQ